MFAFVLKFLLFFCLVIFPETKMALEATFKQTAESFSKEINQTLSNEDLKEVYGLYKQVLTKMIHPKQPTLMTTIDLSPLFANYIHIPVTFLSIDFIVTARPPRVTATQQDPGCWT